MSLVNIVEKAEGKKLEEVGERFKELVSQRKYNEARDYLNGLSEERKIYLKKNNQYKIWLKVLSISSL